MSFVVEVRDEVVERLAGHGGATYTSPTLSGQEAAELVAILLGRSPNGRVEPGIRTEPIAGGRRVVTLRDLGGQQLTLGE